MPLPTGIAEQYIETDDLTYHVLEAGYDASRKKPLILLLHGFPELAFSWRKVMLPLSDNFHLVAYDQRGYGRTTGWDTRPFSGVDLRNFAFSRLVTDAVRLVYALGYKKVKCVIGHDFGSLVASLCALMRGDIFER
jgi:pimeloyl-ACP methyl ester carboxylesterase